MENLPSGTVTFLFTDIEGSTRLWQEQPEKMAISHARHDEILRQAIESNNGYVFQIVGDSFSAAFHNAIDGLGAVLLAQRELQTEAWGETGAIKVRMGLHTGTAKMMPDGKYEGYATLATTQRVMSAAHGGQTLLTQTTFELLQNTLQKDVTLRDMGDHRLKDLRAPLRLYQANVPDLPKDFPAIKSLDTLPNNLPIQLTSFVGREKEISEIKASLKSSRLVTLTGSGGTGKTRLSIEVGTQELAHFTNGVWLVELAPLADSTYIISTVASIFNLREVQGVPLFTTVTDYLRAKNLLLIFDNCEHLIEACAKLADQFLHNASEVKIIVSSREALGINGETIYRVPSLSLPDQTKGTVEALIQCEAVQLFVERASAANPKFNLTERNASLIAQICHRLDGIPLALELASARITVFSVEDIALRLDDRFKLLTGGSRTALPRQQTLRAMIDWSYDILSKSESELLRGLSIFTGGWTYDSAEAIFPKLDVLNLLTQLINKSLVVVEEENGETRYHLLETIRQYARDKLNEAGESDSMRDRHLNFFLNFAEEAEPKINSREAVLWMRRLESEYDNFRTALEWALENNVEAALRLVSALQPSWVRRGHMVEGHHWVSDALAKAETISVLAGRASSSQRKILANAWIALANLMLNLGDNQQVILACEKCLTFARPLGDKRLIAMALTYELYGKLYSGQTEWVSANADEILALARESGDRYLIGLALSASGDAMATIKRDFAGSHANLKEGIALLKESGNLWGLSMGVMSLGITAKFLGEYDEARLQFEACLPAFREIGDQHRVNMCQSELAHIERYQGHYEQALSMYRETIPVWQKLGHRAAIAHQLECVATIAKVTEQDQRAARLFGAADSLREQIHISMTAEERIEYDREVADLRSGMSETEFNSLWSQGRAMTMEQAIGLAMKE